MAREWLLLETLGSEPMVVASGSQPRNMVPLGVFLRRNRNLSLIRRAIVAVTKTNRAASLVAPDTNATIDIRPVAMPDGRVHGVWLWAGSAPPPAAPPADSGAVVLNVDTGELSISDGSALAMGVPPHTVMSVAELYRYITPNPGETDVLRLMVTATDGMSYCATWPGVDHEGRPTLCHFASRLVVEPNDAGVPERIGRAINIRVGTPHGPVPLLEQQILEATAEDGSFRALVTIGTRVLLKWIDPPPPELHWEHDPLDRPKVHPEDEASLNAMIDDTVYGDTEADVRLRCHDDTWMPVHCTAQLVQLSDHATVALVTNTRQPGSPDS